ncbi:MAG: cobalamin B12-binding domain-containing protein [Gemmatimonadetes bacterium]|nr:cobalamin B12-binding domain-containing protein [Gemmatimonadota bacterium]
MIVLYNPWSTPSPKKPLPMSLLAVGSTLEGEHDYEVVDGNLEPDPVGRIVEIGRARKLTAIGVTVMPGPQLNHAVPDTRRLRAVLPDVPMVWGGYFPSQHADAVLRDPAVDFCVHSQGEQTFLELVRVLARGGDLSAIQGLSYRENGNGTVRHNPHRALIPLDELPDWPYHRVPMERYLHKHYLGNRVGTHQSSYGCPFACNFCAVVGMARRRWLPQSAERVARVVEWQRQRYGIDAIQFHDMDFFISEERTAEFAERIQAWGMTWWALGRVDELMRYSDATWEKMRASGLKMLFCGAESGDPAVLKRMNKGGKVSPNLTLELARRTAHCGIVPEFSFVLGSPPDPAADVDGTMRFIRKVKAANPAAEIIMYVYTPVPLEGTLYEEARALGFTFPDTLDEWVSGDWRHFSLRRDPKTPWLRPDIKQRVRNFERVLNAYYPTVTDTRIRGWKRALLRGLGGWRYRTQTYSLPLELRVLQRVFRYQRPETTGF